MKQLASTQKWLAGMAWIIAGLYAAATLFAGPGWPLTVFGDSMQAALMLVICAAFAFQMMQATGRSRWFWALMTGGGLLWLCSQILWSYYELWRRQPAPSPYAGDVVLFLHLVPMMAGLATIPHERKTLPRLMALSLAMVAVWWVFVYAFLVLPWQYVHFDFDRYAPAFNALYAVEDVTLIGFMIVLALRASGAWRRLYLQLLGATVLYAVNAEAISRWIQQKSYYTGSPYDLLFIAPVAWMAYITATFSPPENAPASNEKDIDSNLMTWVSISGLMSVPLAMGWNVSSTAPASVRDFRFLVGVAAIILLALMLFAQQFILSQERLRSLNTAQESLAALAKARELLEYRATHDLMTGILNRAAVLLALERELARSARQNSGVAALLIDLDHFKRINDTFGHHAGDFAIAFASARMQECIRAHDYVGRYGGEEFLVVVPDCEAGTAREIAERMRRSIAEEPPTFDGNEVRITITVGVAMSTPGEQPNSLLKRADRALYSGKDQGRNRVEFAPESRDMKI